MLGLLAALSSIAVFVGASGMGALPADAKGSKHVLLKDALAKPTSAIPEPASAFVNGKYVIQGTDPNLIHSYSPTFDATGPQLSAISAEVDMSLATPGSQGGLQCRGGANNTDRYAFMVRGNGSWVIGKALVPPGGTTATQSALAKGTVKVRPQQTVHLRFECSGPEQPGQTGKIALKFLINGKQVAAVTDAKSPLPVSLPAAVALELDGVGSASFSNMTVAQL
jgi:hypothetical protein